MKKQLYSKENQETILSEMIKPNQRPDLTYLSQLKLSVLKNKNSTPILDDDTGDDFFVTFNNSSELQYINVVSKIPKLVQCAEMLFDITSNDKTSLAHTIVSDLLNSLSND